WNCLDVLDAPILTVPDRCRFPGSASIHDDDRCVIESRISIRADRVRKMVVYESHPWLRRSERSLEYTPARLLVPHTQKVSRRIQNIEIGRRPLPGTVHLQVMAENWPSRLPAEANFVHLIGSHIGKAQARFDRVHGKPRIVLHSADAFLGHGEEQLAVA